MSVHSFFIIQGGETSAGNRALMWETGSNIWWRSFFFSPSPFECHTRMTHGFAPWQFDYFLLYLPRRQINREIKDDAVNFLFAFVSLCLSDGSVAGVCVGGGQKSRRAAWRWQESCRRCFLHPDKAPEWSRWGVSGRWQYRRGFPAGVFRQPQNLSKSSGFPAELRSSLFTCSSQKSWQQCPSSLLAEVKSLLALIWLLDKRDQRRLLPPCSLLVGWRKANLWTK